MESITSNKRAKQCSTCVFNLSYSVNQSVSDQMVQEIAQCDLSRIQLLDLRNNQIIDNVFDLLFQNREWPFLERIYLCTLFNLFSLKQDTKHLLTTYNS
jgi:hypothetical protein